VYQIDIKFDRKLRSATETSWVVLYGGKTIPRWRTAAILKIVISPYLSEKSSELDEILYTAADFELDERHVIKNEKVALDRLRVRQNVFLVILELLRRRYHGLWRNIFSDRAVIHTLRLPTVKSSPRHDVNITQRCQLALLSESRKLWKVGNIGWELSATYCLT